MIPQLISHFSKLKNHVSTNILVFLLAFSAYAQTGIYINNDDTYTANPKVKINIKILGADSILMSHDPAFPAASWIKAEKELNWELLPGDGKKELFIKYKDKDGNESRLITEQIILDTTSPKNGEVEMNHGNNYINFLENVLVESRIQGADWIMVSESANFASARWEPYYPKIKYTFFEGEGERKLYVKFKDHAGNESPIFEDKVIVDTKPPIDPKIEIVHGAIALDSATGKKYLNKHNTLVDLKFSIKEGKYMKIANSGAFFGLKWRLFSEKHYDWELGNYKDGKYRVGVIFRDVAKNETVSIYDEVFVDTSPPFGERITINEGDFYTKTNKATLKIAAVDAHKMMLSESKDFKGAKWEQYKTQKSWKFNEADGVKKIYVKFMDIAENESNTATDEIIKDATPPIKGKITLNKGEKKTLFANAHAEVSAENATFMEISNRADFAGSTWKSYHNNPVFIPLDKTPGIKKVYARFKDDAGNISEGISSEILLEVKPIGMKIAIDENAIYCNKPEREVQIQLFAKDATEMMVSNTPNFEGVAWEPYQIKKTWILNENEGNKKVYAKFKSATETISEIVSDEIILDTSPPIEDSMILNKGVLKTFDKKVMVQVKAADAIYMQISEDSTFGDVPWKGYTNRPLYYIFHNLAGIQTLYARFKDEAENVSGVVKGKVKIEINPVSVGIYINNNSEFCTALDRKVNLHIGARSAEEMKISNKPDFSDASWEPYRHDLAWILDEGEGLKKVYVKVKSKTGIESAPMLDEIILDTQPPQETSLTINAGRERTTKPIIQLNVSAEGAISKQISKYPDFKRARWLPYSTEPFDYFIGNEGGTYTLYARFKDLSGNISEAIADSIVKEIQPHNGIIQIDNDQSFTTNRKREVELELLTVRANEMMLSESAEFSDASWQPFKKSINWQLSDADGVKTIYAKFRSSTLNESSPVKDDILLDRTPPQNCEVIFSNSAWLRYLNPSNIQVKLKADDVYEFQISEYDDFTGRPWQAYTDKPFSFQLSNTKNKLNLYTRFRDFYGNISDTIITPISIDTTPPENNTFIINEGNRYTNNNSITINSYSDDASEIRIANSIQTLKTAKWQAYAAQSSWQLDKGGDNVKIVYVQYKDELGNVTKTASQKIELDKETPKNISTSISGSKYVKHPEGEIMLKLKAEGASKVMIDKVQSFENAQWETYALEKKFLLSNRDGKKDIYVKYGDEAGNESAPIKIEAYLDRVAPKALSISINNEALITNNAKVELSLTAEEAHEMIISNTGLFSLPAKWEPYSTSKKWYLKGQDGQKTVYVKFRDKAGNESNVMTQKILLDTEAPVIYSFEINKGETMVDGVDVELFLKVKYIDGLPDARFMQVSNTKNFSSASWETFNEKVSWRMSGNGLQKVYVRLKDEAGNISVPFSDNLTVY